MYCSVLSYQDVCMWWYVYGYSLSSRQESKVLTRFLCPTGVVNMSFPLSDQPVFGEWFIFVEVQGHTYNKSFEVQKYGETVHVQESYA